MIAMIGERDLYYWNAAEHSLPPHFVWIMYGKGKGGRERRKKSYAEVKYNFFFFLKKINNEQRWQKNRKWNKENECYHVDTVSLTKNINMKLSGIQHVHLLYPLATCHSSLRLHRLRTDKQDYANYDSGEYEYSNPFLPYMSNVSHHDVRENEDDQRREEGRGEGGGGGRGGGRRRNGSSDYNNRNRTDDYNHYYDHDHDHDHDHEHNHGNEEENGDGDDGDDNDNDNKNNDAWKCLHDLTVGLKAPIYPSDTFQSMQSIAGLVFIDSNHQHLYFVQHSSRFKQHKPSSSDAQNYGYEVITKIPLPIQQKRLSSINTAATTTTTPSHSPHNRFSQFSVMDELGLSSKTKEYYETIISSVVLPQTRRDGRISKINCYHILLATSLGRIFRITLTITDSFDHAFTPLTNMWQLNPESSAQNRVLHTLEILFALKDNDLHANQDRKHDSDYNPNNNDKNDKNDNNDNNNNNDNDNNNNNDNDNNNGHGTTTTSTARGWFGSLFNIFSLRSQSRSDIPTTFSERDSSFNADFLKTLRQSGINGDPNLEIKSLCGALNHLGKTVVVYVLRKYSIDCITFSKRSHHVCSFFNTYIYKYMYMYIYIYIYTYIYLYM
ncbi:prespore-specific protein [Reticulomyxa filosa]|uniref:Prespore-specific protein n=1 Tax=Reticulomyxa filosa TaxID=46433 RepID=X6NK58_RETFI|nr:prespore-specific protein [Reticulomyxa filosa]|eukprot:ETO26700.1 prespore-specific protein [Reticulomyxa filosa]